MKSKIPITHSDIAGSPMTPDQQGVYLSLARTGNQLERAERAMAGSAAFTAGSLSSELFELAAEISRIKIRLAILRQRSLR